MKLPPIISKATLKSLAKPDETHVVRVIAHEANNSTVYRLRCRAREYRFERDAKLGRHILDIPVSLWMHGAPTAATRFRDNGSIAEDFRTAERSAFSIHFIPLAAAPAAAPDHYKPDAYSLIRELLIKTDAPGYVQDALKLADMGETNALRCYVDSVLDQPTPEPEAEEPEESPSQARARKMREAKAAKKLQLQNA